MEGKYMMLPAHQATEKNGGVKRIVPVGSKRVLDILFEGIMSAPENSLLSRVHAHDPLLKKVEEVIKSKATKKLRESGSLIMGRKKTVPDFETSVVKLSNDDKGESTSILKDDDAAKFAQMMEKNFALKKFLENKVDVSKFEVKIAPLMMRGIIYEVYKFYSKREGLTADQALKMLEGSTSYQPELLIEKYLPEESQG